MSKFHNGAMTKVRKSDVPLPGAKSKLKPQSKPKENKQISEEFVHSSDDESEVQDAPASKQSKHKEKEKEKSKTKASVTIAVHRPGQNVAVSKPKKAAEPAKKTTVAPPVVNGHERADASSSDESDDGEEEGADYPQEESQETAPAEDESSGESGSESGTVSGSDSEESDEDEEMPDAPTAVAPPTANPAAASTSHTVEFRPPPPFEPPKGFHAVASYTSTFTEALNMFEDLKGKQIWHITAPAGVPMNKIREVALESALNGEPVLNHNNTDYGFSKGEPNETVSARVMVPGKDGYVTVPKKISQTLHLQQVVRLPKIDSNPAHQKATEGPAAYIVTPFNKAPRPQPKGLRMRYFPTGFGDRDPGVLGSSDSEAEALPVRTQPSKKAEKRKHGAAHEPEVAGTPKKHRHKDPDEAKRRREKKEKKRLKEMAKAVK
jgi:hypothetical protein